MRILLCTLLSVLPHDNINPWQRTAQRDDIVVYTREVPDSPLRELKAESIMAIEPQRVWAVIVDTAHYAEFMPYMEEAHRITSDDALTHYEYQRINPPLVKKRDYVLKTVSEPDDDAGLWVHRWQAVTNIGPKATGDAIRVPHVDGSWTLRRLDHGHTHVTYQLLTDPGGALPRWIANRANSQSVPDLLTAVRKRAQDASYKR